MDKKYMYDAIRSKTGLEITEFAEKEKVSRQFIYESCAGKGSRYMRVKIAKILGTLPSQIWYDSPEKQRIIDDMQFNRSMNHG